MGGRGQRERRRKRARRRRWRAIPGRPTGRETATLNGGDHRQEVRGGGRLEQGGRGLVSLAQVKSRGGRLPVAARVGALAKCYRLGRGRSVHLSLGTFRFRLCSSFYFIFYFFFFVFSFLLIFKGLRAVCSSQSASAPSSPFLRPLRRLCCRCSVPPTRRASAVPVCCAGDGERTGEQASRKPRASR